MEVTMKYKNRLIVPTLITTSLLTSGLVASADEKTEENSYIETNANITVETNSNIDDQEYSSETSDTESDISSSQNTEPDKSLHNSGSINETTESNSDEQQNHEYEDITSDTEPLTNEKLSDEDLKSTNDIASEEDNLNQDEDTEVETESIPTQEASFEEDNLSHDENVEIEEEYTSNQIEDKDSDQENTLNHDENVEIEEESIADQSVDEQIEDKDTLSQDNNNQVDEENVLIQDDHNKVEENETSKKESKEKPTDQIEISKDKEDREKEQSDVINKNNVTKMTPYLASTFSIKNIDKADTNTVTDVNYATKLNKKNSGLYSPVTSNKGVSANKFLNHTMFISQKRQLDGTNYYKIHNGLDGAMQGWMKESDLRLFNIYNHEKYNKTFSVSSNYRDDYLLSEPWGTSNQRVKKSKIPAVQYLKHRKRSKSEQLFIITGLSVIQQGGFRTPGCLPTYRHNTLKQTMRHESKAIETQVSIVL